MLVYYSLLGVILYCGVSKKLAEKYEKSENVYFFIIILALFLFAAFRSIQIGADTYQYCSHFLHISETKWIDLRNYYNYEHYYGDIEFGYKIYNKLLSLFKSQQTITIANSLLQVGLISLVIIKQSKDKWLSIFLYFTFCFYQTALNLTPSSFVSYFLFLSFPFIKDEKTIKFLMIVVVGILFHTSAIFFIPLYFLSKIKIHKKSITVTLVICACIFLFFTSFIKILSYVLPESYLMYITDTKEHRGNTIEIVVLLVQLLAICFCILQIDNKTRGTIIKDNNLISWLLIYEVLLYLLSMKISIFQRGAFLFSPYVVVTIPNIISKIENDKRKLLVTLSIIIYGVFIYIIRVQINNVGTTIPYQFFWNK